MSGVPQPHLDHLKRQMDRREPALPFVFIRNVLVAGPIDVSGIELADL